MPQHELEKKVIDIAKELDVKITEDEIEACHRINKGKNAKPNTPRNVIIRFVNRKKCENLLSKKKCVSSIDTKKLGLGGNRIYINNNLCPYYRFIWGQIKNLHSHGIINRFWTFNGVVNYSLTENSAGTKVLHMNDLKSKFPDVDFA